MATVSGLVQADNASPQSSAIPMLVNLFMILVTPYPYDGFRECHKLRERRQRQISVREFRPRAGGYRPDDGMQSTIHPIGRIERQPGTEIQLSVGIGRHRVRVGCDQAA